MSVAAATPTTTTTTAVTPPGGREGSLMPREIIAWLQSLQLSRPIKHPKRDLSNGYLIAEICSKYWPSLVSMHAFENKLSVPNKLSNWVVLRKIFDKHDICLSDKMVTGMVQCKAQYAEAFLRQLYTLLTGRIIREAPPPVAATVAMPKYTPGSFMPHMKDSMEVYQHLTQQQQQQQQLPPAEGGPSYEAGPQSAMSEGHDRDAQSNRGQAVSESHAAREARGAMPGAQGSTGLTSNTNNNNNTSSVVNNFFGEAPMSSAPATATPVLRPIAEAALSDSYVSDEENEESNNHNNNNNEDDENDEGEHAKKEAKAKRSPGGKRRPRFAVTVQTTTQSTTVQPVHTPPEGGSHATESNGPHAMSAPHDEQSPHHKHGNTKMEGEGEADDGGGCVGVLDRVVRRVVGRREWRLGADCPRYIDYFLQHDRTLPPGLQNQIWTALFGQLGECVRRVRLHSLALAELALVLLQLPQYTSTGHVTSSHGGVRVNSRAFHLLAALLAHLADSDPHYTHATFVQSLLPLPALRAALRAMDFHLGELYASLVAAVVPSDRGTARALLPGLLAALHSAIVAAHDADGVHAQLAFLLVLRALVRRLVRIAHGVAFGQAPHAALALTAGRDGVAGFDREEGESSNSGGEDDMHTFLLRQAIAHTVAALSAESPQLRLGGAALAVTLCEVGCPCTTLLHTLLPLLFGTAQPNAANANGEAQAVAASAFVRVLPPSLTASPLFCVMQAMWLHSAQERCARLLMHQQPQSQLQQQQRVSYGRGGSLPRRSLPSTQGRRSNLSHMESTLPQAELRANSSGGGHAAVEPGLAERHLSWQERQSAAAWRLQRSMRPLLAELCRLVRAPGGALRCKALIIYELACTLPFLPDEQSATMATTMPSASFSMATTATNTTAAMTMTTAMNAAPAMQAVAGDRADETPQVCEALREEVATTVMYFYGQRATPELIALALAAPGPATSLAGANTTAATGAAAAAGGGGGNRRVQVIAEGPAAAGDEGRHTSLLHPSLSALPGATSPSSLNNNNNNNNNATSGAGRATTPPSPQTTANSSTSNSSSNAPVPHACVWQHAILGPLCTPELIAHSCPVLLAAALPSVFPMTHDKRDAGRRLAARALALAREKVAPAYLASRITWLYAIVMSHTRPDALTLNSLASSAHHHGMESAAVQRRWGQVLRQSYDDIALITTAAELALRQHSRNADDSLAALLELAAKAQRVVVRCYLDRLTGAGAARETRPEESGGLAKAHATPATATNNEAGSRVGSMSSRAETAETEQATMAEAMAWYHETFREVDL